MPVAGLVVSGAIAAYSAKKQSDAAKSASKAQAQATDQASQVQWDMYNQNRTDLEPWRQAGLTGLNQYMALLGLPTNNVAAATAPAGAPSSSNEYLSGKGMNAQLYYSDPAYRDAFNEVAALHNLDPQQGFTRGGMDLGKISADIQNRYLTKSRAANPATTGGIQANPMSQQQAFDAFRATPGYQFGLDEGQKTLQSSAAAAGGLFSGKAGKALVKFGTDYADQQGYQPYVNRIASLAGLGQTATNTIGGYGQNTANNVGNGLLSAGNARASGIAGSANAWGNFAGGLAGMLGNYGAQKGYF